MKTFQRFICVGLLVAIFATLSSCILLPGYFYLRDRLEYAREEQDSIIEASRRYVRNKQYVEAIAYLENGLEKYPDNKRLKDELQKVRDEYEPIRLENLRIARERREQQEAAEAQRQEQLRQQRERERIESERRAEQQRLDQERRRQEQAQLAAQRAAAQAEETAKLRALLRFDGYYTLLSQNPAASNSLFRSFRFIDTGTNIVVYAVTLNRATGLGLLRENISLSSTDATKIVFGRLTWEVPTPTDPTRPRASIISNGSGSSSNLFILLESTPSLARRQYFRIYPDRIRPDDLYLISFYSATNWSYQTAAGQVRESYSNTGHPLLRYEYAPTTGIVQMFYRDETTASYNVIDMGNLLVDNTGIYRLKE